LFAVGESVPIQRLAEIVEQDAKTTASILRNISDRYQRENRGLQLIEINNAWQMCTNPAYCEAIQALLQQPRKRALTQVLLETLAIIAYKQPITKAQIEEIRGVNADHAINRLMEYNLIVEKGRLDAPYKPILFGTSDEFLRYFGFHNLDALPSLPENTEYLQQEAEQEVDETLGN